MTSAKSECTEPIACEECFKVVGYIDQGNIDGSVTFYCVNCVKDTK